MNPKLYVCLYLLVNNIFISLYFISKILNSIIIQPDYLAKNKMEVTYYGRVLLKWNPLHVYIQNIFVHCLIQSYWRRSIVNI